MKKKITACLMAAVLTAGAGLPVYAEDFKSDKSWSVTFNGESMESSYTAAEMAAEVYRLLPGDSMEITLLTKNVSDTQADWYMTNEVLQTLEDSQSSAEGGAYTYDLVYTGPDGSETVLYSSDTVGGENASGGEGLHQATGSLENYFYLGRLAAGENGQVRLKVALDGETQGNGYQDTLAKLQMNFAVEKVGKETQEDGGGGHTVTTPPPTGDPTKLLGMSALALASGILLLALGIGSIRSRDEEDETEKGKEI